MAERNSKNVQLPASQPRRRTEIVVQETHIGPLPQPEILRQYDNIVPGAAERILSLTERQAEHRQFLEKIVISGDSKRADRGLWCGLTVALAVLVVGGILIYMGHDWAGGVFVSLDIASLAGVFVYGTISRRSERIQKAMTMKSAKPTNDNST